MGVIKRQGIKQSLVKYIGIAFGIFNILFFYPLFLGEEKIGIINFLNSIAALATGFSLFGVSNVTIKFFPDFKNEKNHNNFLSFILLWGILGFLLFLIVVFCLYPYIENFFSKKPPEYLIYLPYVLPIVLFLVLESILRFYISNFNRIVIPIVISQSYKVFVPAISFLYFSGYISFEYVIKGIIGFYALQVTCLILYTYVLGQLKLGVDFSAFTSLKIKEIATYASYSILMVMGSLLVNKIDILMVASLKTFSDTGIYTIALFIATVIRAPGEAIINISSPIIAKSFAENDMEEIDKIYTKSSIILWTIGLLFLIGISSNLDNLFGLMPDGDIYAKGKYVVLILGVGILFDLLTSVNGQIIGYSNFFRFNFYILIFLAVINIIANLIFIPRFDINGAAIATSFSMILYNLAKLIFVYIKFELIPFSMKTITVLLIAVSTYLLATLIPSISNLLLDIILRSLFITVTFTSLILYFEISEDITGFIYQIKNKVFSFFK